MLKKTLLIATILGACASPVLAQQSPAPGQMPPTQQQNQRQSPFDRADANKDGVITLEEVRTARTAAFTRLDVNRDGFLVREEMPPPPEGRRGGERPMERLSEVREKLKTRVSGGRVNLSDADTNKDGTITRAEFDAAWTAREATQAAEATARRGRMFAFLDTSGDGVISREEVAAAPGRSSVMHERRAPMQGGVGPTGEPMAGQQGARPNPDTNNDGKVSLTEWLARPDPLFERGDANKDGRVTREEAAAVVREGRGEGGRNGRPW
jgi:Ca2+-binding EF-hand superfamily protein